MIAWSVVSSVCFLVGLGVLTAGVATDRILWVISGGFGVLVNGLMFMLNVQDSRRARQMEAWMLGLRASEPWAPPAVPDAIEEVYGYRVWRATTSWFGLRHSLTSLWYSDSKWPARRPMAADCTRGTLLHPGEPAPVQQFPFSCGCGIYLVKSRMDGTLKVDFPDHATPFVVGIAKGWGRVQKHRGGWRVQYARPVALIAMYASPPGTALCPPPVLRKLAKRYEIPIYDRLVTPEEVRS